MKKISNPYFWAFFAFIIVTIAIMWIFEIELPYNVIQIIGGLILAVSVFILYRIIR